MRKVLVIFSVITVCASGAVQANCVGTNMYQNCYDQSGNNYQVQRYGNTTLVQGSNAQTGNTWSQTSQTYGNTTHHYGTAADGNQWNSTTQTFGNQSHTYGTDSRGNTFSTTCNQFGCF